MDVRVAAVFTLAFIEACAAIVTACHPPAMIGVGIVVAQGFGFMLQLLLAVHIWRHA